MTTIFIIASIFFGMAALAVPLAKRTGMGSVLGYLLAGMAVNFILRTIAPYIGFHASDELLDKLTHLSEFGVILMLFLIGLELKLSALWQMKKEIFGIGGTQTIITTFLITFLCIQFGLTWQVGLAIGLSLALSSTAIILQTLQEKNWINTPAGKTSFSTLLFQDIAVIPILAFLPLLAEGVIFSRSPHLLSIYLFQFIPNWLQPLSSLAAIIAITFLAKYAVNPIFRYIASSKLKEIFTTAALGLVMTIAAIMAIFDLSPALGVFIAGVILSESEYRHQIESDIEPFKGLLLGLFFMAVGASFNFDLFLTKPFLIVGLALGLILLKGLILLIIGWIFRIEKSQNLLFALSLAQGGEFAFVILASAMRLNVISPEIAKVLKLIVALSMIMTPLLFVLYEKFFLPRFIRENEFQEPDAINERNPILVLGFGRFGQIVVRLLASCGYRTTVLDYDQENIKFLRRFGWKVFYGDVLRLDLLEKAGIKQASFVVVAIEDPKKCLELVKLIQKNYPGTELLVRARDRRVAYELLASGVNYVTRETFDSALNLGQDALKLLGFSDEAASKMKQRFAELDEQSMVDLALFWIQSEEKYIDASKHNQEQLQALLQKELHKFRFGTGKAPKNLP